MSKIIIIPKDSDFSLHNIPFGICVIDDEMRACTRIGDSVIDLYECCENGFFDEIEIPEDVFRTGFLNDFIELGKEKTSAVRKKIQKVFSEEDELIKSIKLHQASEVEMLLPIAVGDYTDFYSSREHATNVGIMFRDPANALLPNWLHLPVGYHGRASSIVNSGTPIFRPKGQTLPIGAENPIFGPSKQIDFELEMAFVVGKETEMGDHITTQEAEDYIFGLLLFNDWSARDIQKWEYVPLGPFLAKNFASTVSPWVVTLEALEPFKVQGPTQEPEVLPYLKYEGQKNYDINLYVDIVTQNGVKKTVSESNFKYMYWNIAQQLAHHTVNGCNVNIGDLLASGTISGQTPESYGSMLEIAWKGTKPIMMPDGSERKFIEDFDTVVLRGWAEKDGIRVGFGECVSQILPSK